MTSFFVYYLLRTGSTGFPATDIRDGARRSGKSTAPISSALGKRGGIGILVVDSPRLFRYRCGDAAVDSLAFSGTVREPTRRGGAGHGGWCFRPRGGDVLTAFRPRSQVFGSCPTGRDRGESRRPELSDGPNEPYTSRLLDTLEKYTSSDVSSRSDLCTTLSVLHPGVVQSATCWQPQLQSLIHPLLKPAQEIEINLSQEVFYSITD